MKDAGFSLVELLIAMALSLTLCGAVFSSIDPAHGAFLTQPETADMQQRLRVAAHTLSSELAMAGDGAASGAGITPIAKLMPTVLPYRMGPTSPDPAGTFRADAITVLSVPRLAAQTTIAETIRTDIATTVVNVTAGCPSAGTARDPACGFMPGTSALVWDDSGSIDFFTITGVSGSTISLRHMRGPLTHAYDVNSRIVPIRMPTYYLKSDTATDTYQLIRYNGLASDAAVVDHLAALSFQYFGVSAAGDDASQVEIAPGELVDGPWQPDSMNVNRYDADLRRVRRVGVRLRVESAVAALRGPASLFFVHGGTGTSSHRLVPDLEMKLDVAPVNLNVTP